ncbi:MAG TPA: serine/threonine-protein kinase [Polyangiaceae bacterium]
MASGPSSDPSVSARPRDLIGQTLRGSYRILESLDSGGMGVVFSAEHVRLRRRVAVKVLAQHLAADGSALARFQREADIISRLAHPHIVQILDFDTTEDGAPYIVMEMLEGESLAQRLATRGRVELVECVRISAQVASALASAHSAGIVHRDLKPANIYLVNVGGEQNFVKLLDFGISKHASSAALTGEFDILGTPDYMAPEQAMGRTALVDPRADQFSLAAISYEMLAGDTPFAADDVSSVLGRVINDTPLTLRERGIDVPADVDRVLLQAMAKSPADRFADVSVFIDELARAASCSISVMPRAVLLSKRAPAPSNAPSERESHSPLAVTIAASASPGSSKAPGPDENSVSRELIAAIEQARLALGFEDMERAVRYAETALSLAEEHTEPKIVELLQRARTLFELIYEQRLGPRDRRISVRSMPSSSTPGAGSPVHAFLFSRLDGITLDEALDISPLPRQDTLRLLLQLLQQGSIAVR